MAPNPKEIIDCLDIFRPLYIKTKIREKTERARLNQPQPVSEPIKLRVKTPISE